MRIPDIHFAQQGWWMLLLAIPVIALLFWQLKKYRLWAVTTFFQSMQKHRLILPRSHLFDSVRISCILLAWIFIVLALMNPEGEGEYIDQIAGGGQSGNRNLLSQEVVFLLDVSASMGVADAPQKMNRLDFAKELIDQISRRLQGQMVSLHVFTTRVIEVVPATFDTLYLRLILREVAFNEGGVAGTDLSSVLELVKNQYAEEEEGSSALKTVILLTDGGDTLFETAKGPLQQKRLEEILSAGDKLQMKGGMSFYAVGIGSPSGGTVPQVVYQGHPVHSQLQEELLKEIALRWKGQYFAAREQSSLALSSSLLGRILSEKAPTRLIPGYGSSSAGSSSQDDVIYRLYHQWPIGAALVFLAAVLLLPETDARRKPIGSGLILLLFAFMHFRADALVADVLRLERYGEAYFEAGQYGSSLEMYRQMEEGAAVAYNQAVSLLAQGKTQEGSDLLQRLAPSEDPSPFLWRSIHLARGWSLLQQVKDEGLSPPLDSPLIASRFLVASLQLQKAEDDLQKARQLDCQLVEMSGGSSCSIAEEIQSLLQEIFHLRSIFPSDLSWENVKKEFDEALSKFKQREVNSWTAEGILQTLVHLQQEAYSLHEVVRWMPYQEVKENGYEEKIDALERMTLEFNEKFRQAVFEEQENVYRHGGCSPVPWRGVLRLYQEGVDAASEASEHLKMGESHSALAKRYLQSALELWTQALILLKHTDKVSQERQKPEEQSMASKDYSKEKIEDLFLSLEEMEQADRSLFQSLKEPVQQGERPW